MIVLDTHIWVWWAHGHKQLSDTQAGAIVANEIDTIGVSAISQTKSLWQQPEYMAARL